MKKNKPPKKPPPDPPSKPPSQKLPTDHGGGEMRQGQQNPKRDLRIRLSRNDLKRRK